MIDVSMLDEIVESLLFLSGNGLKEIGRAHV